MTARRIHFYGFYFDHGLKRYVETIQIRELVGDGRGSRLLDDGLTGEVYRTWKEAERVNGEKNARLGKQFAVA